MINCVFFFFVLTLFLFGGVSVFVFSIQKSSQRIQYMFSLQKGRSPRWPADGARGHGSADEAVLTPRDTPSQLFSPSYSGTGNQPSLSCVSSTT